MLHRWRSFCFTFVGDTLFYTTGTNGRRCSLTACDWPGLEFLIWAWDFGLVFHENVDTALSDESYSFDLTFNLLYCT